MSPSIQNLVRKLRADIISGHIRSTSTQLLISNAQDLQQAFSIENAPTVLRHSLARMLIYIYNCLQRRLSDSLSNERIDTNGLQNNNNSPLAGTLEQIPVFNFLDIWVSSLNQVAPQPNRPRQRHSQHVPHPTIQRNTVVVLPNPISTVPISEQDASSLVRSQNTAATTSENSAIETAGQALELVNFGAGVVELGTVIAAATGSAAALGTFLGLFGLATAIVGSIVGLIAAWASADRLGEFNARCQGYWTAIGDMAAQFSNPDFLRLPRNQWPQLREANPHLQPMPREAEEQLSTAVQAWRRGEQLGCREANLMIRRFSTIPFRWIRPNGQVLLINDGRIFLHALYIGFRGNVRQGIQRHIDSEIRRQNEGRGWPLLR